MTRSDYAKQINWKGTASRMIKVDTLEEYKVGQKINPGMCWTDGGEFKVENDAEYAVVFKITEDVEGHMVDYDNEDECYDLGCEDCQYEKEIIIDREFEIVDVWEYDAETGYAEIYIK